MNVTVILVVIGALGTIHEGLEKGLEHLKIRRLIETLQSIILLRFARILGRVLETSGDLLFLKLR